MNNFGLDLHSTVCPLHSPRMVAPLEASFCVTGLFSPDASSEESTFSSFVEVESCGIQPQLQMRQVALPGKKGTSAGVAFLCGERLLALVTPSFTYAAFEQMTNLAPSFSPTKIQFSENSISTCVASEGVDFSSPPWLNALAPIFAIFPRRLLQVHLVTRESLAKREFRCSSFVRPDVKVPCILPLFSKKASSGASPDVPVLLALDDEHWVLLSGSLEADHGILLKADVVLEVPSFVALAKDREERERFVTSSARLLEESQLQDGILATLRVSENAFGEHTNDVVANFIAAKKEANDLVIAFTSSGGELLQPIAQCRIKGVLQWSVALRFENIVFQTTLLSSSGRRLEEALLYVDGELVCAGIRPHMRAIAREMRTFVPAKDAIYSLDEVLSAQHGHNQASSDATKQKDDT